jgi:hypothetical protein
MEHSDIEIATEIRMRRTSESFEGTFVIVEGRSDKLIYEELFDEANCTFIVSNGKEKAMGAIEILDEDNFQGALAIIDADFSRLEGQAISSLNIILTDEHDLETMLIKSPAFDKLIKELGSEDKIRQFNQNIREFLILEGKKLGYLKWLSLKKDLCLKFEDLSFNKFVDTVSLKIDDKKLVTTVKNHSQKQELSELDILNSLEGLRDNAHDPWQVCCGHDLIGIISIGLTKAWGTKNTHEVQLELLQRELRLAYEKSYFLNTQLYLSLQEWEKNNISYKILLPIMVQ